MNGTYADLLEVDVAAIEQELREFWKSTGESGQEAVMRACSCNLVAVVSNRKEAAEFPPIVARVAESHPSRSIIAYVEPEEATHSSAIRAWISAQCSPAVSVTPQVCCESITLAAQPGAAKDLPNTIVSLLVPDLPVFLYWRSFTAAGRILVERIARFSDTLIVDSHRSRQDPQNRLNLLQLLIAQPEKTTVRDLNWSRITAWRDLIAQFFDPPDARKHLDLISTIEITRQLSAPGSIPTRTLLLTGWLASSLGWRRTSARRRGDQWFSSWSTGGGEVKVTFTGTEARPGETPGISRIAIRTRGGEAKFVVSAEPDSFRLNATTAIEDCRISHSVAQDPLDEASLLIRELSHSGRDVVFVPALREALELEKSFREDTQG